VSGYGRGWIRADQQVATTTLSEHSAHLLGIALACLAKQGYTEYLRYIRAPSNCDARCPLRNTHLGSPTYHIQGSSPHRQLLCRRRSHRILAPPRERCSPLDLTDTTTIASSFEDDRKQSRFLEFKIPPRVRGGVSLPTCVYLTVTVSRCGERWAAFFNGRIRRVTLGNAIPVSCTYRTYFYQGPMKGPMNLTGRDTSRFLLDDLCDLRGVTQGKLTRRIVGKNLRVDFSYKANSQGRPFHTPCSTIPLSTTMPLSCNGVHNNIQPPTKAT
jgi:hypothetical protein